MEQYEAQRKAAEEADPLRYRALRQRLLDAQSKRTTHTPAQK
jgi:hypothetical protein